MSPLDGGSRQNRRPAVGRAHQVGHLVLDAVGKDGAVADDQGRTPKDWPRGHRPSTPGPAGRTPTCRSGRRSRWRSPTDRHRGRPCPTSSTGSRWRTEWSPPRPGFRPAGPEAGPPAARWSPPATSNRWQPSAGPARSGPVPRRRTGSGCPGPARPDRPRPTGRLGRDRWSEAGPGPAWWPAPSPRSSMSSRHWVSG